MARNQPSRGSTGGPRRGATTLLVLSDARLRLDALVRLLCRVASLRASGLWVPWEEAPQRVAQLRPEILLLDLPLDAALLTASRVTRGIPGVRVVALCSQEQERHAMTLTRAGVTGFLPSDCSLADVRSTVDSVLRGEVRFPPRIAAQAIRLAAEDAEGAPSARDIAALTEREREILRLIDRGLTNREIAGSLRVEVATVKNHVHNILEKLHVSRRGAATSVLRRSGWLPLTSESDASTGRDGSE